MTRPEMAEFIRKIADKAFTTEEWQRVMVAHYEDVPTESARVFAVELCTGYSDVPVTRRKEFLLARAAELEGPINALNFYYRGRSAGTLTEALPEGGEAKIVYEPSRNGSHHDMQIALRDGKSPVCEFMNGNRRLRFTILDCPAYGRLRVRIESP
jgi:hypothetical protein